MTILVILYLYAISTVAGRDAPVPPILLLAPFADIILIVVWFINIF